MNDIIDNISTSLDCTSINENNDSTYKTIKENNKELNKMLPIMFTVGTSYVNTKKSEKSKKKKSQSKYKFKDKGEFVQELKLLLKIPRKLKTDGEIITWMEKQSKYLKKNNEKLISLEQENNKLECIFNTLCISTTISHNINNNLDMNVNTNTNVNLDRCELDCFEKYNKFVNLIEQICQQNNAKLHPTLIRFYKYINFGEKVLTKTLNTEIKKKLKNKRQLEQKNENNTENKIYDFSYIVKQNAEREIRIKKRIKDSFNDKHSKM
jgi:hypothetical protein